ncbi:translation initiation factor IF-2-like [Penaeus monodon]|uniref:translation initiation factor IF-2-like n=1 Tax=Penaeus monodon TaxID=6687 RepID=UPI0018A772B4|nr:translation initiation factor IF-2-like [Penaeus monodon]
MVKATPARREPRLRIVIPRTAKTAPLPRRPSAQAARERARASDRLGDRFREWLSKRGPLVRSLGPLSSRGASTRPLASYQAQGLQPPPLPASQGTRPRNAPRPPRLAARFPRKKKRIDSTNTNLVPPPGKTKRKAGQTRPTRLGAAARAERCVARPDRRSGRPSGLRRSRAERRDQQRSQVPRVSAQMAPPPASRTTRMLRTRPHSLPSPPLPPLEPGASSSWAGGRQAAPRNVAALDMKLA